MNFLIKIFSRSCLAISLAFFLYIFYRSEIYWDGNKHDIYFNYYFFSIALIIFSFFSFYLSKTIKEYIIISLFSIILGLYIFEGYLTLNVNKLNTTNNNLEENFDPRTKREVYEEFKKKNIKVAVNVAPKNYINEKNTIFPLSGISNVETIYCKENGFFSKYQSDKFGFNNPNEDWNKKKY